MANTFPRQLHKFPNSHTNLTFAYKAIYLFPYTVYLLLYLLAPAPVPAAVSHDQTVTLQRTQKDIQPSILSSKQVPAPTTTRLKWALRFQCSLPQFRFFLLIQLVDHNKRLVCPILADPGRSFPCIFALLRTFFLSLLIFALCTLRFPRSHALVTPFVGWEN